MCDLNICRVCLIKDVRGYYLNTNNLRQYYEEIMCFQLNPRDNLPKWFCYECTALLQKFHKFREKCYNGSRLLNELLWNGKITYDNINNINRCTENLNSTLDFTITDKHVRTYKIKHRSAKQPKYLEQIIVNCSQDFDKEPIQNILEQKITEEVTIKSETLQDIDIKTDIDIDTIDKIEDIDSIDRDRDNIEDIDNGIDKDIDIAIDKTEIEKNDTSDDENIFLDILKKANNKLFLNTKLKKESSKKKFLKKKTDPFSTDVWKKIILTEEEALAEFKKREFDSKYVNANFKCKSCYKGFSRFDMLERHLKFRHSESEGDIICRFCDMHFDMKHKLKKHIVTHYVIYQCLICDMKFNLESSATFHANYHSGEVKKCKYCGQCFNHVSTYYSHVRTSHRSEHLCGACGASFVSTAGLRQHTRLKHYHVQEVQEEVSEGIYCEKCDVKFVSESAYQTHFANSKLHTAPTDDNIQYYKEKVSKNVLTGKAPLLRRAKPTTCRHCGEYFKTQAACMKHHLETHPRKPFYSNDTRVICEICGASLAAVSIMSHMNKHTRAQMFSCEICGMQFTSKSSHYRHQVTHTGERRYACPLCDKRFTQRGSMKLHYNTFHLKQPYPKRIRKKKTDEIPLVESCRNRSEIDSSEPNNANRWR